jgi:uncharacterized protein YbbC (DUF1343 family)/CubicO group peptidase (beta-lactamase class C family)
MRSLLRLSLLGILLAGCASTNGTQGFDRQRLQEIDMTIRQAIAEKKVPGGVFWLERGDSVYHRAYGQRALVPAREPMSEETIFDAASLTKVTATTPAIFMLLERGLIQLDAPVSTYIPEFRGGWRDEITIRHLLTHTSGLRPDVDLDRPWQGYETGVALAIAEEPRNRPGYVFRYSDINFILLGDIVRRISGLRLDDFAAREIYGPLGMSDTRFRASDRPQRNDLARIAPTERISPAEALHLGSDMLRGVVHDPSSRRMGGVAGHAGLFTTAHDLAIYARCILNGGAPVLKPETVRLMTSVLSPPHVALRRGGGWDIDTSYSRPRGDVFPLGSFGHTGFTGGALWIDPFSRTFWIFLSNRVHPDGHGSVVALYRRLGTLAAESIEGFDFQHVPGALPPRPGGTIDFVTSDGATQNGIDALAAGAYRELQHLNVGLITNHTGIDRSGNPTIDLLYSAPGIKLVSLFSPEHGIRGEADANVADAVDQGSGLPIHSLYGATRKPTAEQLAGLDALVFDIQDIGARFYTYMTTMTLAMEAAAASHIRFIVLDRVNPIGGLAVEGPLNEKNSFIAFHDVPVRHGMTAGELAQMIKAENHLDLDLTVIGLRNWKRDQWLDQTGLHWINTSPNMRSLGAATLYPGIGLVESAISVGRGTPTPFELAGAPYIDGALLAREVEALRLPGIRFTSTRFTPDASIFKGQACGGVRFLVTDRTVFQPVRTGIALAVTLQRLYPGQFALDKVAPLLLNTPVLEAIRAGRSLEQIDALLLRDEQAFEARRAKYLLYR